MKKQFEAFGAPQDGLIEECAEVIKAICKAERFGYRNYHPDNPKACNAEDILNEINDLERRINELKPILKTYVDKFNYEAGINEQGST